MTIHSRRRAAVLLSVALMVVPVARPAEAAATSEFMDTAGDAYRLGPVALAPHADPPPSEALSDASADILAGGFRTVAVKGHRHTYTVFLRIAGPPTADNNYYVAGDFGPDCEVFYFLEPGTTSKANAFCGTSDVQTEPSQLVGTMAGGAVSVESDDGRWTLSATYTFDGRRAPAALRASPVLGPLRAVTCAGTGDDWACRPEEKVDTGSGEAATFDLAP